MIPVYHPDFKITIDPKFSSRFDPAIIEKATRKVFAVQTHADISQPAGSWTIQTCAPEVFSMLGPMDEVKICLSREDSLENEEKTLVMRGMADRVSKQFSVAERSGQMLFEVQGRNMAKILLEQHLTYTPYILPGSSFDPKLQRQITVNTGGSAADAFNKIIGYVAEYYPRIREVINFNPVLSKIGAEGFKFIRDWCADEGAAWASLIQILESPFHIYWIDHSGAFQFMTLKEAMEQSPDIVIKYEDIHSWEWSKADYDKITFDFVVPMTSVFGNHMIFSSEWGYAPQDAQGQIIQDEIRTFGFRMRQFEDRFSDSKAKANEAAKNALKYFSNVRSTQVTVKGDPKYRVGKMVTVEPMNEVYFLESVSHDFQWGSHYYTTLGLVRGDDLVRSVA